jgi:hypothetical protein
LAQSITNNEYLQFSFTTNSNTFNAVLDWIGFVNNLSTNGQFSLTYSISKDGFLSKTDLGTFVQTAGEGGITPGGRRALNTTDFALEKNKTYTVRIYFYNLASTTATINVDDFIVVFDYCATDTDGDGIINSLDLDSDGDGCPDAIEGAGSFIFNNLVNSTMNGGNTGTGYTGTSTSSVNLNLGTTVDNLCSSTTYGVPIVSPSATAVTQAIGTSTNVGVKDPACEIITVVTESGTVASATGGTVIANVTSNDLINGAAVVLGTGGNGVVATSGTWPAGITLNTTTGAITVAPGTAAGTYTITYQLCDLSSTPHCKTMDDTITITCPVIATPTITTTAATCSADGTASISNYNTNYTYTFTPSGPSVSGTGAITGLNCNTSYTVKATSGICISSDSNHL